MILVTGANGLIGSFIIRQLLDEGLPVQALVRKNSDLSLLNDLLPHLTLVEGDIMDAPLLQKIFKNVDTVVHAAAIVSFVPREEDKMLQVNVNGTANVVDACLQAGVKKLCHISSVAALGRKKGVTEVDETAKWETSEHNSAYARTKYLAELEVWRGVAEGLQAVVLNPSVVLGPGDWNKSSVKLFKYIWNENLFYTGGSINWVDVRDVARAVSLVIQQPVAGERFVVNAGTLPYKDFFGKIANTWGRRIPPIQITPALAAIAWRVEKVKSLLTGKAPLVTRETASVSQKNYIFKNTKIKKDLGFNFTPIDVTIEWTCMTLTSKYSLASKNLQSGN
jgi:dihydroflavonol-4-reductase